MREIIKKYWELIVYILFGVATTAVNWVVYSVLVAVLHCGITVSNAVAWLIAVEFAFWTNKAFVFRSKKRDLRTILRECLSFVGTRVLSGVIEVFLPVVLILLGLDRALLGIDGFFAKAATSVIVIVLNYILSKLLVFRKK